MSNWSPEPHELFADNNPGYMRKSNPELEKKLASSIQYPYPIPTMVDMIRESDWFADQIAIVLEELADDYTEITSTELRHIAEDVRARVL